MININHNMNIDKMTIKELHNICRGNKKLYRGFSSYTKPALIKFIKSKMPPPQLTGLNLLEMIKNNDSAADILHSFDSFSERGNVYEKLWDFVIKFSCFKKFKKYNTVHYSGNINTCKVEPINNLEIYIKNLKILSKNEGGASDITMKYKKGNRWIFISSKFYLDDNNKTIKDYDIQDILAAASEKSYFYKSFHIYLLVNNKEKVENIIKGAKDTNLYLTSKIKQLYCLEDLEEYFKILKRKLGKIDFNISKINDSFFIKKEQLEMRFHQKLIIYKTMKMIDCGNVNFLWGWKCRAGKTYGIGGLLVDYLRHYEKCNALIITPAPTETLPQFTTDLFFKFKDFDDFNVIKIKNGKDLTNIEMKKNNIIIVSKQLLDRYVGSKKIKTIGKLDIIVFDENHYGGTTIRSKNIINTYSVASTIKLYLTATYQKPLSEWNILNGCQFYWDIEDEQLCKRRDICGLVSKHGGEVEKFINKENSNDVLGVYDKMPDMNIFTTLMDSKKYDIIKEKIMNSNYGFSMEVLFSLCKSEKEFNYPEEVIKVLRYISGSNKENDFPYEDRSFFTRIKNTSLLKGSRTILDNGHFTSQLWFLPFGQNMKIDKVSECLKRKILNDKILKDYDVMIINSKKQYKLKNLRLEIKQREIKAQAEKKTGLILLAGNQCSLGITLPLVDIVILLNNTLSSDRILQMMYRCMNESEHGDKKIGYIVDLNISRVLNTVLDYNIHNKNLTTNKKIKHLIKNNLINIDGDLFFTKENKSDLVNKLMEIWKSDPINNLKRILKRIENNVIELENGDQRLLNEYFTSSGDKTAHVDIKFDEEAEQGDLQSGKIIENEELQQNKKENNKNGGEENDKDEGKEKTIEEIKISLTKDILPFIIPLSCILTMDDNKIDFLEMLKTIKRDNELFDVFNEQSFIWWNKKDIIVMIEEIIKKYIKKNSDIYNIAIQFKTSLWSLIDRPKELLELIDNCLKPKLIEKKKYGEVFTPMSLINEMLDKLDEHYKEKYKHSIFSVADYKWYDPANGMGNFTIAIYIRLMEGLKDKIKNDEERKKHILENMLYMSELNKKNVFVCKQIFDINNKYKLNLYCGDSLKLDIKKEWGIDKFDVIVGNPPYNKGGIRSCSGKLLGEKNETVWTHFVNQSFLQLKLDGYLIFITPLSWLNKTHSLHDVLLKKHIIWLTLWDDSQSKNIIHGEIPISLYILNNIVNDKKMTKINSILRRRKINLYTYEYLNYKYSIPLAFHNIFNKVIDFIEKNNLKLEYCIKTISTIVNSNKQKLPIVYNADDNFAVDTYTIKDGILVKRAMKKHPDQEKNKIIIANKIGFNGAFIDYGKLSLTGGMKFYILGNKLELLIKIFKFKIINLISNLTKYNQNFLNKEAFSFIPDIRKLSIDDIGEMEFYKMIKLTDDEITLIKKTK